MAVGAPLGKSCEVQALAWNRQVARAPPPEGSGGRHPAGGEVGAFAPLLEGSGGGRPAGGEVGGACAPAKAVAVGALPKAQWWRLAPH